MGQVPCAWPKLDALLEDNGLLGKKRAWAYVLRTSVSACCQVTGCEADSSKLKGYPLGHRVCLQCAATVFDGEAKEILSTVWEVRFELIIMNLEMFIL